MNRQKMVILISVIIAIVVVSSTILLLLISSPTNKTKEINVTSSPFLWRIEGDNPSYLYGSIHLADEEVLTLPDIVISALDDVDVVYTEIKLDAETQSEIAQYYLLPEDQKLEYLIPDDTYTRLDSYLGTKGLSASIFSQYKIWSVASTITVLDDLENMLKNPQLDQYIWNLAAAKGKNVDGIETVEEQVNIFDTLSNEEQIQMLDDTLDSLEGYAARGESPIGVSLKAYLTGDLETLNNLLLSDFDENDPLDVKLKERLITNRNYNMVERISKLIEDNPNTQFFFTIGAGHYWGDDGIVELLENEGFNITRVQFNVCDSCGPGEININQRCYVPYTR